MTTPTAPGAVCTADTLVIAETFTSIQGEGPSAGRSATFIRLGGCNLTCRWCDSAYTWDGARFDLRAELARVEVADILAATERAGAELAVITGGEPLLHQQQEGWRTLLDGLTDLGRRVEVETNGTVRADAHTVARVAQFNVSPKLSHAGMEESRRIVPDVLHAFLATGKAAFKWVCRTPEDVDQVALYAADIGIPRHLTWIMPEGWTPDVLAAVTRNIMPRVLSYRFSYTTRQHILIWGDERGR